MRIRGIEMLKNLGRVYFAQSISFCLTIIMTLYTPKFLGVTQFSYWQLFLLYTSYTGLMQLGLNDGIYLRYGGKKLTYENCSIISGQLFVVVAVILTIYTCIFTIFSTYAENPIYKWLCFLICIYGVIGNINGYLVYLLQSTNMIKLYAHSVILDKLFLIIAVITLGLANCTDYRILAIIYTFGVILADLLMICKSNRVVITPFKINRSIFIEIKENITAGFPLMLSGLASSLIIGICRFMISDNYPIETFGIISLSFTLTVFVLGFISQIGMVIYPILKTKNLEFHKIFFPKIENLINQIIPFAFIVLPIIVLIITNYLPKYTETIPYLITVFPLCLFETQNSILLNTYMKVFRDERKLLFVNATSFLFSLIFCSIAIYLLNNITIALIAVTGCIILKSQIMQNIISKKLEVISPFNWNIAFTAIYYILFFMNIHLYIIVSLLILFNAILLIKNKKNVLETISIFINRSNN